jgi:hypothetical protein
VLLCRLASHRPKAAVKAEQRRGGSDDGFVGPLSLCLDAQMGTRFGEGDLDLPATDEQYDDVGRFERDVGAEESLWRPFAVGISDQHPADGLKRPGFSGGSYL